MQTQYEALLVENQHVLEDLSKSLKARLVEWAHPEATIKLEWRQDPDKSFVWTNRWRALSQEKEYSRASLPGSDMDCSGRICWLYFRNWRRLTTPHRRVSFLVSKSRALQHPPQARHLATVLQRLSAGNSQIIVSTHSPLFVSGEGFENVRSVRKNVADKRSNRNACVLCGHRRRRRCGDRDAPKKAEGVLAKIHKRFSHLSTKCFSQHA